MDRPKTVGTAGTGTGTLEVRGIDRKGKGSVRRDEKSHGRGNERVRKRQMDKEHGRNGCGRKPMEDAGSEMLDSDLFLTIAGVPGPFGLTKELSPR